jgi:hypothetical protein
LVLHASLSQFDEVANDIHDIRSVFDFVFSDSVDVRHSFKWAE